MITIKGTEEETDYIIDCMIDNCDGCPARKACREESKACKNCIDKSCDVCIEEGKRCGEMIREAINIIVEG